MAVPAEDSRDWIGLSLITGLGGETFRRLLSAFGAPQQIYATSVSALCHHVSTDIARQIADGPDESALAPALAWLGQPGNSIVTLADSAYPQTLLEIPDPPPLLYVKGNAAYLNHPAIAVVGSRNATPQGLKNAEAFAQALSEAGWCVVSGLALGVDGASHRGALRGPGSTIAVVGTGLDIVYPARHRELAHEICAKGVIVSEFALGEPSKAANFPRRNRLISGLARGVLVVEANLESGSLITARLAGEQGREVFAIPGSIHSPLSKGCHRLIKQGAKLVDSIHDILEELGGAPISQASPEVPDDAAHPLLDQMGYEAVAIDTLTQRSGLTSDQVSAMLLTLELEGKVASLPGGRYQRVN
jgi:DNA processing protein